VRRFFDVIEGSSKCRELTPADRLVLESSLRMRQNVTRFILTDRRDDSSQFRSSKADREVLGDLRRADNERKPLYERGKESRAEH
jgi:hypothetical protein